MEKNPKKGNALMNALNKILKGNAVSLDITTSTGEMLVFPDLAVGDTPKVGDLATLDGKPAEGEIMDVDGKTYIFDADKKGEVVEIKEPASESEEMTALKTENERLKTELETVTASYKTVIKEVKTIKAGIVSGKFNSSDDDEDEDEATKTEAANKKAAKGGNEGGDITAKLAALKAKKRGV